MINTLRLRVFGFILIVTTVVGFAAATVWSSHILANEYAASVSVSTRQKAIAYELSSIALFKLQTQNNQPISDTEVHDFQMLLSKWDGAQKALSYGDAVYGTSSDISRELHNKLQNASPYCYILKKPPVGGLNIFNQSALGG